LYFFYLPAATPFFPFSENMTPKAVNETTGLINENYYDSMEVQIDSFSSSESDDDQEYKNNQNAVSRNCKRFIFAYKRTIFMILLGIALLSASMLGLMIFRPKSTSSSSNTNDNGDDSDNDSDAEVPTGDRPFPLSLLDPIHDLGLAGWDRSPDESSFPSFYYNDDDDADDDGENNNSRKLSGASENKNSTNNNKKKKKALPTNAWYQNMLQMPQDDEPSNLQRTYPVPYLVDVVGLIPGLRIHATDIDASDMVMQLSFNEISGLVLGATEHLSSKKKTVQSHRYKVLETTNLGITLEWVRSNIPIFIVCTCVPTVFLFLYQTKYYDIKLSL
jgi:hypothetical protein